MRDYRECINCGRDLSLCHCTWEQMGLAAQRRREEEAQERLRELLKEEKEATTHG